MNATAICSSGICIHFAWVRVNENHQRTGSFLISSPFSYFAHWNHASIAGPVNGSEFWEETKIYVLFWNRTYNNQRMLKIVTYLIHSPQNVEKTFYYSFLINSRKFPKNISLMMVTTEHKQRIKILFSIG